MTRLLVLAAIALVGSLADAGMSPSAAQDVLTAPGEIANCLCLEHAVNDRRTEMDSDKQARESEQLRLDILKEQIEQQRPRVDVNDPASIEAFKALLDRYDAEQTRFQHEVTSRYADSVQRYNTAVEAFNAPCRGKLYAAEIAAALRPNLNCPRR